MKVLVTGASGHLGEALMRALPGLGHTPIGLDHRAGPLLSVQGSITDPDCVEAVMATGVEAVIHTATLHKPQVAFRPKRDFVDVNIQGTLVLLETARKAGVTRFVFTSTTSAFGDALEPEPGQPAVWVDEAVVPVPKNIYGATKCAAEDLCALFARNEGMQITVLRTSRFFPEADDSAGARAAFGDANLKANEFLHRRVDVEDIVQAQVLAIEAERGPSFGRYVISAPPPFGAEHLARLPVEADKVIAEVFPDAPQIYADAGYRLPQRISRVYSSGRAVADLGWRPRYDFRKILEQIEQRAPIGSDLARAVGIKGYESSTYGDGVFPDQA